jgi:hypothetical protein
VVSPWIGALIKSAIPPVHGDHHTRQRGFQDKSRAFCFWTGYGAVQGIRLTKAAVDAGIRETHAALNPVKALKDFPLFQNSLPSIANSISAGPAGL